MKKTNSHLWRLYYYFIYGRIPPLADTALTLIAQTLWPVASGIVLTTAGACIVLLIIALWLVLKLRRIITDQSSPPEFKPFQFYLQHLNARQIGSLLKKRMALKGNVHKKTLLFAGASLLMIPVNGQTTEPATSLLGQPGIIITLILIIVPLLAVSLLLLSKAGSLIRQYRTRQNENEAQLLADH